MPDMREEFEAVYPLPEGMERNGESYTGGEMWWLWEERWQVWQRSRAALRVELTAKRSYSMYATKYECHAFNDAIEKAKEALQQAGIEVK
ncbi:hypothetical protein [Pseudomonas aeruginosa]|uniref:hypothetical protein n=1 Tax=Pseudomonas aeruginosa TaxID=287 RepID=UPI001BCA009A|nr:hypothetical protein [Pseudomonas aeruginosa]